MIHLVIHLPLEALEGGPIRPRWMFPFERYMKKLKGYVRNKAKPEGSIAEGYVAEEALTFSSHYFRDVTTKFNRPDRNVDPPPPTCQFQVFRSVCKSIGLRSVIRFDAQELKKVKWYVLHNSPEIDTYRSQFKSLFPNKDMKEEFPEWFGSQIRQRHVDNDKDPEVSTTSELFALACGPTWTPISINSCVVDGVSLNDLDNATLHIDGQSTEVDAPPDIIDVVDQDDDITDDEDALPHDLADSDDEDLINVDDDGVDKMSADVARSHGGDGGGEDRPPPHHVPCGCMGCFPNRGKGKRKPNLGGRAAGRLNTRDKTWNLSLKEVTDKKGPISIRFELRDKQTCMPLGDHAAYWSSYIGEVIKGVPLYYPSWLKVTKERKAALITYIGAYNTNKAAFKAQHWVIDPTTGTYDVEKIRRARPEDITAEEWEKGRAQAVRSTRRSLTPSLRHTLLTGNSFGMRTDEEMRRLEATGTYTDDEINRLARRGKHRGHILGVGRFESGGANGSGGCGDDKESADAQEDEDEDGDGDIAGLSLGERNPDEASQRRFPSDMSAGENLSQRHVAWERVMNVASGKTFPNVEKPICLRTSKSQG
ncbi:DIE2/ALG10 family protein [Tanacetum coccineum]